MGTAGESPQGAACGDGADLLGVLRAEAARQGIDRLAVADPGRRPDPAVLAEWLAAGMQAGMAYLERYRELRLDPEGLLPGVRSIVCVAWAYHPRPGPGETGSEERPCGSGPRVSRYALGRDYHRLLRSKLWALVERARVHRPGLRARVAVDTAPILERHWAVAAGLGWWGRNGCVIVPDLGSYVFLGEILLDEALPAGAPLESRCGECGRCLQACPTGALVAPGRLDARRCIAYWTVEHRGEFPDETPPLSPWLFGCDACQEACPWNRGLAPVTGEDRAPAWPDQPADLKDWMKLSIGDFERHLKQTPMERIGFAGLRRNALRLARESPGEAPDARPGREP